LGLLVLSPRLGGGWLSAACSLAVLDDGVAGRVVTDFTP
jgi:hypothetical protein